MDVFVKDENGLKGLRVKAYSGRLTLLLLAQMEYGSLTCNVAHEQFA